MVVVSQKPKRYFLVYSIVVELSEFEISFELKKALKA